VVGQLSSNKFVSLGHRLAQESKHQPVHRPEVVDVGRIVELLVEPDEKGQLLEVLGAPGQAVPDEAVAEAEGRRGDGVGQRGVDGGVVVALVAAGLELQLEDVDDGLAEDDREPLVEGDVLHQGPDYFSGLLKQPEIV